jgi:hypothetical protein
VWWETINRSIEPLEGSGDTISKDDKKKDIKKKKK